MNLTLNLLSVNVILLWKTSIIVGGNCSVEQLYYDNFQYCAVLSVLYNLWLVLTQMSKYLTSLDSADTSQLNDPHPAMQVCSGDPSPIVDTCKLTDLVCVSSTCKNSVYCS